MGSTRGQIAYECHMTTKFGKKNPWMYSIVGVEGHQWSSRVNQIPIAHKRPKPANVGNAALALEQEK